MCPTIDVDEEIQHPSNTFQSQEPILMKRERGSISLQYPEYRILCNSFRILGSDFTHFIVGDITGFTISHKFEVK